MRNVVIDSAASYRSAITAELLPNAQLVVDHFHLVRLANDTVTQLRRASPGSCATALAARSTPSGPTDGDC
jgi:transposase